MVRSRIFAAISGLAALCAMALFAAAPAAPKTSGPLFASPPDMIVIHAVGGPICDLSLNRVIYNMVENDVAFWKAYLERQDVTGIHYIVGRDGAVAASIPETQVANHASGANSHAIGIELVNRGDSLEPFPPEQVAAVVALVKDIRSRHAIPLANIVTHADADQRTCPCDGSDFRRRQDPGSEFPMNRLRDEVAAPGEPAGVSTLRPLTGAAPPNACPTQP